MAENTATNKYITQLESFWGREQAPVEDVAVLPKQRRKKAHDRDQLRGDHDGCGGGGIQFAPCCPGSSEHDERDITDWRRQPECEGSAPKVTSKHFKHFEQSTWIVSYGRHHRVLART